MHFQNAKYCCLNEICELREHDTPKEALIEFCHQQIIEPPKFKSPRHTTPETCGGLYPFYMFSAAVTHGGGAGVASLFGNPTTRMYGHEFAKFIKENGLGEVWQSPARQNTTFHPEHDNIVWIWMPDVKALEKWWKANKT